MRLAFAFRQTFHKDVVVDMVCYRRYGHNEGDEPAFTQPRDVRADRRAPLGAQALHRDARRTAATSPSRSARRRSRTSGPGSSSAFDETHDARRRSRRRPDARHRRAGPGRRPPSRPACTATTLDRVVDCARRRGPTASPSHPKLERILAGRAQRVRRGQVDWALAEALAFGSLLLEGTPVRLAGQDTRRGTFSQRHGVLVDTTTEHGVRRRSQHLAPDQAPLSDLRLRAVRVRRTRLRIRLLGRATRHAGRCWEAQFGDFANGAQIIIDQFIVAAEDKWGQHSGSSLLLPHGFEGQGPEHSSARIERFLALVRGGQPAGRATRRTAAQYFHVLRRQAHSRPGRSRSCASRPSDTCACRESRVRRRRPDQRRLPPRARRSRSATLDTDPRPSSASCSAPASSATSSMDARDAPHEPVAIVRVEQLYPWPETELRASSTGTRTRTRSGGSRRSRRTWAHGTTCTAGCTGCCAAGPS